MNKRNLDSAFPIMPPVDSDDRSAPHYPYPESGMTLRDYFAAKAMHAEVVTAGALEGPRDALIEAAESAGQSITERIAFNAYEMADAMLAEREKAR